MMAVRQAHVAPRRVPTMSTPAENFALALRENTQRGDQTRIAARLGISTSVVNDWFKGRAEPNARQAVLIEEELGVEPGSLTIHLGFLPPVAGTVNIDTPEKAIIADGRLTGRQKRSLLDLIEQMVEQSG